MEIGSIIKIFFLVRNENKKSSKNARLPSQPPLEANEEIAVSLIRVGNGVAFRRAVTVIA